MLTACLSAATSLGAGCATMVNGTTQMVPVQTTPAGATVNVNGQAFETPCLLHLARSRSHELLITKEDYAPVHVPIAHVPTRATLGNIWVGGLIGMAVDAASGADNQLLPAQVNVVLVPEAGQWREAENTVARRFYSQPLQASSIAWKRD
jgi:hypothetical protein